MKKKRDSMTVLKSIVTEHAIERAMQAEELVRELEEALEEAIKVISCQVWRHELDVERLADLGRWGDTLIKAKKVLGDEA